MGRIFPQHWHRDPLSKHNIYLSWRKNFHSKHFAKKLKWRRRFTRRRRAKRMRGINVDGWRIDIKRGYLSFVHDVAVISPGNLSSSSWTRSCTSRCVATKYIVHVNTVSKKRPFNVSEMVILAGIIYIPHDSSSAVRDCHVPICDNLYGSVVRTVITRWPFNLHKSIILQRYFLGDALI